MLQGAEVYSFHRFKQVTEQKKSDRTWHEEQCYTLLIMIYRQTKYLCSTPVEQLQGEPPRWSQDYKEQICNVPVQPAKAWTMRDVHADLCHQTLRAPLTSWRVTCSLWLAS